MPIRRPLALAAALAVAVVLGAGAAALLVSGGSGGSARAAGAGAADGQAVKTIVLGVPVPSVVGLRLDAAKRTLESRGFDHKVHGGGLLGVLDDSNWIVCRASERAGTPMARGARIEVWVERSCA